MILVYVVVYSRVVLDGQAKATFYADSAPEYCVISMKLKN